MADPLAAFEASLKGLAPKTQSAYLFEMHRFGAWMGKVTQRESFQIDMLTEAAVRGYLDDLSAKGYAPRTRSKALAAIGRFCRWAVGQDMMRHNPVRDVERPTVVAAAPRELTLEQRFTLKNIVEKEESNRLAALFALAYWAGLRVSEIAELKERHCHVNQRAGSLTVLDGKGNKSRTLDLHNRARRALYAYLYENKLGTDARDPESDYVFTGQRSAWMRRQGRPDHLTTRAIQLIWQKMKQGAAYAEWEQVKDVGLHDLRHDWAHRARAAGWKLEEIAIYAGHQTQDGMPAIATTVRYTLPSRSQLKERIKTLPG